MPDNDGLLKGKDGVFTGLYPKELFISNTPVNFGGTLFAMTPLPAEEDEYRIITQAIHSLFHRFQEISGTSSLAIIPITWMKRKPGSGLNLNGMPQESYDNEGKNSSWLSGMH